MPGAGIPLPQTGPGPYIRTAMSKEMRTSPRIRSHLAVRYGYVTVDRSAVAENISEGGLYIRTNQVLSVGSQISMEIEFPERTVVHTGEVLWAIRVPEHMTETMVCGMGIRFIDTIPGWTEFFARWKGRVAKS